MLTIEWNILWSVWTYALRLHKGVENYLNGHGKCYDMNVIRGSHGMLASHWPLTLNTGLWLVNTSFPLGSRWSLTTIENNWSWDVYDHSWKYKYHQREIAASDMWGSYMFIFYKSIKKDLIKVMFTIEFMNIQCMKWVLIRFVKC